MPNLSFAKMQLSDLDKVMEIETSCYPVPWSKGVMRDCINSDYHCIVLKQADTIVGYGVLMTAYDESHLLNMCVNPKHQGQGMGKKLLNYFENICIYNRSKAFLLEVRVSSPIARSLYKSFGFQQIGVRKNYYKCIDGREDAIVMTKQLIMDS